MIKPPREKTPRAPRAPRDTNLTITVSSRSKQLLNETGILLGTGSMTETIRRAVAFTHQMLLLQEEGPLSYKGKDGIERVLLVVRDR